MRLIEVKALDNGAHNNQTIYGVDSFAFPVPEGWAVIPDDMECENFPFGEIEVDYSGEYPAVTRWTPGVIPEPEPDPVEPGPSEPSVWDELQAAYEEGVNSAYDE